MTTENRWARPTMTEVEWMNDDLPAVFSEERVRRTLDTATDGAFMLVPTSRTTSPSKSTNSETITSKTARPWPIGTPLGGRGIATPSNSTE